VYVYTYAEKGRRRIHVRIAEMLVEIGKVVCIRVLAALSFGSEAISDQKVSTVSKDVKYLLA